MQVERLFCRFLDKTVWSLVHRLPLMTRKEVSIGSNYPTGLPVSHPPNKAPMILRKGLKMVASSVGSSHDDGGRPNSARITAAAAREQLSLGIVELRPAPNLHPPLWFRSVPNPPALFPRCTRLHTLGTMVVLLR